MFMPQGFSKRQLNPADGDAAQTAQVGAERRSLSPSLPTGRGEATAHHGFDFCLPRASGIGLLDVLSGTPSAQALPSS